MKKLLPKLVPGIVISFVISCTFTGAVLANDSENLTPEQLNDVKEGKERTEYVRENWDELYKPTDEAKEP